MVAMPLVIVAVVVADVMTAWLDPVGPQPSQNHTEGQPTETEGADQAQLGSKTRPPE
jgi:hypothetical protein